MCLTLCDLLTVDYFCTFKGEQHSLEYKYKERVHEKIHPTFIYCGVKQALFIIWTRVIISNISNPMITRESVPVGLMMLFPDVTQSPKIEECTAVTRDSMWLFWNEM